LTKGTFECATTLSKKTLDIMTFSIMTLVLNLKTVLLSVGNCAIHVKQKISFMNEIKWYEIWPGLKGWVQKIFQTLPPNIIECRYLSHYATCHRNA